MTSQQYGLLKTQYSYIGNLGMTLIELMLTVVIIGILATLVFPSFQQQIREARRGDGITHLLRLKLQQESFRTQHPSYAKINELSLPQNDYYSFSISNVSATTYEITANAKGSQKKDVNCLKISINQSMHRKPKKCFR